MHGSAVPGTARSGDPYSNPCKQQASDGVLDSVSASASARTLRESGVVEATSSPMTARKCRSLYAAGGAAMIAQWSCRSRRSTISHQQLSSMVRKIPAQSSGHYMHNNAGITFFLAKGALLVLVPARTTDAVNKEQ